MQFSDMLAPPPVMLPADPAEPFTTPSSAAFEHPESPAAWAALAEAMLSPTLSSDAGDDASLHRDAVLHGYACARTGYHRGLDRLRANGWKGWGPIPWSHQPNRGVLRAIAMLARASRLIGDDAEYERCEQMLRDADEEAANLLLE